MPYKAKSDLPDNVRNVLPAMPRTFTKKRLIAPGSNIKIKPIVVMTPVARKPHTKSPGRRLKTIMKKARMINGIRKNKRGITHVLA